MRGSLAAKQGSEECSDPGPIEAKGKGGPCLELAIRQRIPSILATFALAAALPCSVSSAAQPQPPPDCRVLFVGAHGLNEDANSTTLKNTWAAFHAYSEQHGGFGGDKKMLPYPKMGTKQFIAAIRANPENPQMSSLPAVNQGVEMLDTAVRDYLKQCPSGGGVVLTGYSEGAWIVDEFLRRYYGLSAVVKAVQLYGDPLYEDPNTGDLGLARLYGFASNFPSPYPDSTLEGPNIVRSRCIEKDPICGGGFRAAHSVGNVGRQTIAAINCARNHSYCKSHTDSYSGRIAKQGGEFLAAQSFTPD
ncbi:cutinase family protein [Streptomyces sp. NPDC056479]|uniref:cutinase family protein n=1 Tax=Streptomyces sp. NPDC056479 TaxID=3345832 RepID=UPI0036818919